MKLKQMSEVAKGILAQEEIDSIRIVNRLRYVFAVLIAVPLVITSIDSGQEYGGYVNTSALFCIWC